MTEVTLDKEAVRGLGDLLEAINAESKLLQMMIVEIGSEGTVPPEWRRLVRKLSDVNCKIKGLLAREILSVGDKDFEAFRSTGAELKLELQSIAVARAHHLKELTGALTVAMLMNAKGYSNKSVIMIDEIKESISTSTQRYVKMCARKGY